MIVDRGSAASVGCFEPLRMTRRGKPKAAAPLRQLELIILPEENKRVNSSGGGVNRAFCESDNGYPYMDEKVCTTKQRGSDSGSA